MTREEAIEYNKNLRVYMRITDKESEHKFLKENYEALDMAIKALEQEPCEDAISRSSLLKKLDDCYKEKIKVAPDNMAEGFVQVEKLIKQEPPVRPTPKKGKWNILGCDLYICSKCYAKFTHKFNYCPYCGAEMESEE